GSWIEFGLAIRTCGLDPSNYVDYGCFCGLKGAGTPVDTVDQCCKDHDDKYGAAPKGCDCLTQTYELGTGAGDCMQLSCPKTNEYGNDQTDCQLYCCKADVAAAQCFKSTSAAYSRSYYDWSDNGNPGPTCSKLKGKTYACESGYIPATAT